MSDHPEITPTTRPWSEVAAQGKKRKKRVALVVAAIAAGLVAVIVGGFLVAGTLRPVPPVLAAGNRSPTGVSIPAEPIIGDVSLSGIRTNRTLTRDSGPAILAGGLVIVADDTEKTFSGVSLETGETVWNVVLADDLEQWYPDGDAQWFEFLTSPSSDVVLVRVLGGRIESPKLLAAYSAADGSLLWTVDLAPSEVPRGFDLQAAPNGDVLLSASVPDKNGDLTGLLRLIEAANGSVIWEAETKTGWPVDVRADRVFALTETAVEVLDLADGRLLDSWPSTCLSAPDVKNRPFWAPSSIGSVFVAEDANHVTRVCSAVGQELWSPGAASVWRVRDDWGGDATLPLPTSQLLLAGSSGVSLHNASTGEKLWSTETSIPDSQSSVVRAGDLLGYTDEDGSYVVLNAVDGSESWRMPPSTGSNPVDALWTGSEVILSDGASVLALDPESGDQIWSFALPTGADGELGRFAVIGTRAFVWLDGAYRQLVVPE